MSAIRIVVAALALLGVAASPVAADHGYWPDGGVDPAAVTDHRAPSEGSRDPDYWGPACVAVPNFDVYGHVLDADYELAVVIAEMNGQEVDGPFAVTLFGAPSAGEFLWADANGDMEFAGHEADAAQLIVCESVFDRWMPLTDTAVPPDGVPAGAAGPGMPRSVPLLAAFWAAVAAWVAIGSRYTEDSRD